MSCSPVARVSFALACALGTTAAQGQAPPAPVATVDGYVTESRAAPGDLFAGKVVCRQEPVTSGFGSGCLPAGGSALFGAFADARTLRVGAYANVYGDGGSGTLTGLSATVNARASNSLVFTGTVPYSLTFAFGLTGDPEWARVGATQTGVVAEYLFQTQGANGGGSGSLTWVISDGPQYTRGAEILRRDFGMFTARASSVMQLLSFMQVSGALQNGNGFLAGAAEAQFQHTGQILYTRAFDAQGVDISDQVQATLGTGEAYVFGAPRVSTVPEPGTWALLGTGLLAVGGVARRRRGTDA